MSSTTCHLSSIEICNGDDVVIVPIKYTHLTETSQLVYGTNSSCTIAHLPLFGKYDDYGKVILNKESEEICNIFRLNINKYLMNNKKNFEKKAQSIFHTDSFYIFKRNDFNEADSVKWYSDIEIINLSNNIDTLFKINEITSNKELLDYLDISAIVETNGRVVNRFGYLLVRKDIYNSMIKEMYSDNIKRITNNIQSLFNNKEDYHLTENHLSSNVLELTNSDNYLVFKTLIIINLFIKTKQTSESFLDGLLHLSLICKIYSDLGKSFYPNVRRHSNLKPLYVFNSILKEHIEKQKEDNIKNWKIDNSEEIPEYKKWNDFK